MATSDNFDGTISVTLTGTVSAGGVGIERDTFGMYMKGGDSGAVVPFKIRGRINGVKKKAGTSLTWTAGQKLYWDNTTEKQFQTNATGGSTLTNTPIAAAAAIAGATTGDIILL